MNTEVRPQTLHANFFWTLIGNGFYAACQWAMLTAIARIGTPGMVGQFALGLAVSAPVIMFANLQLRAVLATDARRDVPFQIYLILRLGTSALAMVVIVGIALAGGYTSEMRGVLVLVGLAKSIEAVSDIYFGRLQSDERMDMVSRRVILKGLLALVFMIGFLLLKKNLIFGVIGLALADILSLLVYDIQRGKTAPIKDKTQFRSSGREASPVEIWPPLIKLVWTALPLGVVMMLVSLNTNIPRYFLEHHLGEQNLGIFAALAYLIAVGTMVTSALGQSALPRLAGLFDSEKLSQYLRLLRKMILIGIIIGISSLVIVIAYGRPLLAFIYGKEYAAHSYLLKWLMIAGGIQYIASFLGYGMTAARQFKPQIPLFGVVSSAGILMSILFIPAKGLIGATFVLIGTGILQVLGSSLVISRAIKYKINNTGNDS